MKTIEQIQIGDSASFTKTVTETDIIMYAGISGDFNPAHMDAEAAKKELIAGGLQVSQLEDEDQWKKAAIEKVWPEMADFVGGKDAINEYLKACGKDAWK